MMAAAVGGQEGPAAALRPVEHAGQIDAGLADQPAAEFDRETRGRQQRRRIAQRVVELGRDPVDVERNIAWPARNVETTAEVKLRERSADRLRNVACMGD